VMSPIRRRSVSSRPRRVVVTGLGTILPTGNSPAQLWEALLTGRSAVDRLTRIHDPQIEDVALAAEVREFSIDDYTRSKLRKFMDRSGSFAVAAAKSCLEDARIDLDSLDDRRLDLCIGSCCSALAWGEEQFRKVHDSTPNALHPHASIKAYPGNLVGLVTITLGLQGRGLVFSNLDSSGIDALVYGVDLIRSGRSRRVLVGASEAPLCLCTFLLMRGSQLLSRRMDHPVSASRPFDRDRDGMVLSEGSVMLLLEDAEEAERRGCRAYSEILGHATVAAGRSPAVASPARQATSPGVQAIRAALEQSGARPAQVDYVNSGASSLPRLDEQETLDLDEVFRERSTPVPVSSVKSLVGNPLAAAGPLQVAACALALSTGELPPNHHLEATTHEGAGVQFLDRPVAAAPDLALVTTASCFHETSTALVQARI
jgi:3-oxoacyl-[acyl-carrier-protein] synthase II